MTANAAAPARDSPYQGLTPFDERDAAFFFGREKDARLIVADLFAAPFTLLYGASGVGKSSVLRAGVLPLLRQRDDVLPVLFRDWSADPRSRLKGTVSTALFALAPVGSKPYRRYRDIVLKNEYEPLPSFLRICADAAKRRLMIILDQFEEFSLYHAAEESFANEFAAAARLGDLSVSFMLSLREDGLAGLDRFEGRIPRLFDSLRRIDHLDDAAARRAITEPLKEFSARGGSGSGPVGVDDKLVDEVLSQVRTGQVQVGESGRGILAPQAGGRIETPYLQLVMTRLWNEERDAGSSVIRLETLHRLGDAQAIVRTHLDRVMGRFDIKEQEVAARVFHRLVTPSGAKIAHSVRDLAEYEAVDPVMLNKVVVALTEGNERILRQVAAPPERPEEPRYEIFHDRLAPAILAWRLQFLAGAKRHEEKQEVQDLRELTEEVVFAALDALTMPQQGLCRRIIDYFATSNFLFASPERLASATGSPRAPLLGTLDALVGRGIFRRSKVQSGKPDEPLYGPAHEALPPILTRWRGRAPTSKRAGDAPAARGAASAVPVSDPPYALIGDLLRKQRVLLVLGAGVAASGRKEGLAWSPEADFPPSDAELASFLASRADYQPGDTISGLPDVASYYTLRMDRLLLEKTLDEIFRRVEKPTEAHLYFAKLAAASPLAIMTTTFDTLMESALDRARVPYDLAFNIATRDRTLRVGWLPHGETSVQVVHIREIKPTPGACLLYKLFGTAASSKGQGAYLVTEEDQVALLAGASAGALGSSAMDEQFPWRNVLYVGVGLAGWGERMLFGSLRAPGREDMRAWAIVPGATAQEAVRWQAINAKLFNQDVNAFIAGLRGATSISA